ncbi:hypothetical protein ACSDR0_16130 [Streptosporangium sp. G11]|uniref:hypothetical protein n=1 Tax=Streptosporangium sp. G11 TaxID=3436926 RepID=UPI003EB77A7D
MTTHGTPGLAARLRRDLADRLTRTGCLRGPAYGLTVSGERQHVWLGDPGGPSWDLPV